MDAPRPLAGPAPRYGTSWRTSLLLLAIYAGIYAFMFRDVLFALPSLLRGESVLSGDELVPFFDVQSQFVDQLQGKFSELTNGYEFRVRYSVLTTWMRYAPVLPFAILLTPILCTWITALAYARFARRLVTGLSDGAIVRGSAAAALLLNVILVYSKITHFYTLIIGWTLFTVALLLLLRSLFLGERHPYRTLVAANLLVAFNPAVHYIVLFGIACALLGCVWLFLRLRGSGKVAPLRVAIWMAVALVVVTLLPYAAFVKFYVLNGIPDIDDTVPVNYYLIRNASVPLLHQLSFDMAGIMDNILRGEYLTRWPRFSNLAYFVLTCVPLIPAVRRCLFPGTNHAVTAIVALLLVCTWCTLGYSLPAFVPTFHRILGAIVSFTYAHDALPLELVTRASHTLVEILRFPHRFQLATFSLAGILLSVGWAWLETDAVSRLSERPRLRAGVVIAALVIVFPLPLLSNWEYRDALLSGNLGHFLSPYPLDRLADVKGVLDRMPPGRTIVIPPAEAAKRATDEHGVTHKFIDKFYIYFLNKPSYYYGLGGSVENKNDFLFFYRAVLYGEYGWINILRNERVKYVVLNKELGPSAVGAQYLKNIESVLGGKIEGLDAYLKKVHENEGFILYELVDEQAGKPEHLFLDVHWDEFVCKQESSLELSRKFSFSYGMVNLSEEDRPIVVLTEDERKSRLDLYLKEHPEIFIRPDNTIFPFQPNIIPSALYFGNIFSIFNLFSDGKYNYTNMIMPGAYNTLTSTFVALPRPATIRFRAAVPARGRYAVLLRGVTTKNRLAIDAGGGRSFRRDTDEEESAMTYYLLRSLHADKPVYVDVDPYSPEELAELIPENIIPISYQFNYLQLGTIDADAGELTLTMEKSDANPMIVEGIALVPLEQFRRGDFEVPRARFLSPDDGASLLNE